MAVQTTYSREMAIAFAGMIADAHRNYSIVSMINSEASAEMPFGVFVAKKATGGDKSTSLIATNATLPIAGLLLHSMDYSKGDIGELGDTGLKPYAMLNVMRRGRAYVAVAGAVAVGDPVHVVYAGARQKGSVANAHVNAETFLLNNAKFQTSTSGAGFAVVEFDVLFGATAGATS